MASPFRYFRKYAKVMMASFVVILMISWVVGDSLMGLMGMGSRSNATGGGRPTDKSVAVSWNGGSLTNQELGILQHRRNILNQFLYQLEMQGIQPSIEANVPPSKLSVDPL